MRHSGGKVLCASNLSQIGKGLLIYSNDNHGALPRTIYDPADPVIRAYTGAAARNPFAADGPRPNDVTAALYLLVRTADLSSKTFICDGTRFWTPMDLGPDNETALRHSNFPSEKNLSYSLANPYPSPAAERDGYLWTNHFTADFAIAADMNPGTLQLRTLTPRSTREEMKAGNSRNHSSAGQNILYGDFHCEFQQSPFAGVQDDNIYGSGALLNAGTPQESVDPLVTGNSFAASPAHKYDTVLLPVAQTDPMTMPPLTPAQEQWQLVTPPRPLGWVATAVVGIWAVRCIRLISRARSNRVRPSESDHASPN